MNPTGITGFVGVSEKGPINIPQPLRNWPEYTLVFGGFVDYGYLAESVFGFFLNGGEKCWVTRAADTRNRANENQPPSCRAVDLLRRASNADKILDANGDETLRIEAIDEGSWGNEARFFVQGQGSREIELTQLKSAAIATDTQIAVDSVFDIAPGDTLLLAHAADAAVFWSGQAQSVNAGAGTVNLSKALGAAFPAGSKLRGRGFRIDVVFRGRRETFDNLSMTRGNPRYAVDVINGDPAITGYVEKQANGNSAVIRMRQVFGAGDASRFKPVSLPGAGAPPQQQAEGAHLDGGGDGFTYAAATFRGAAATPLFPVRAKADRGRSGNGIIVRSSAFRTTAALRTPGDTGSAARVVAGRIAGFAAGDNVTITNAAVNETQTLLRIDPGQTLVLANNLAKAYPVGAGLSVADRFNLSVFREGDTEPAEEFLNLSGNPASPRFYQTLVNAGSALICVDAPLNPFATLTPDPDHPPSVTLTGGTDPGDMDYRYYTGYEPDGSFFAPPEAQPGDRIGLAAFEAVDDVSLVAMPDLVLLFRPGLDKAADIQNFVNAQRDLLRHCAKLGERFALLDAPENQAISDIALWPQRFREAALRRFGALYYPWTLASFEARDRATPPSGLIAGVAAHSDILNGVSKAPANSVVKSAFDTGIPINGRFQPLNVDRDAQDTLNPRGVNCLGKFEIEAIRINGARTLSDEPSSRYVNIRRTLLSVIKELYVNMLWTVFEPNDPSLWRQVENSLRRFFQSLLARGVTASDRPDDAFFVKCDSETNPPEQVQAGQMVAEAGIALLAPAEFIVLTAKRTPGNLRVIEEET